MSDEPKILTTEEIVELLEGLREHYGEDMYYGDHEWVEPMLAVTNSHIALLKRLSEQEQAKRSIRSFNESCAEMNQTIRALRRDPEYLDALDAALEALTDIAEERYPENSPLRLEFYDLEGDHEFDARHAYPCRIQWLTDQARAALAAVATPQEQEATDGR